MSRVEFGLSLFGESVVVSEHLSSTDTSIRWFFVLSTLLTGLIVSSQLIAFTARSPLRWLRITALGAVLSGTWHYADNIYSPAKHHEPAWLYRALLLAPMDKTWGFQFPMHALLLIGVNQLLANGLLDTQSPRRARQSAIRLGALLIAASGAAHCVTAGHLGVNPITAYEWDAALSIVVQTAFGLALILFSLQTFQQQKQH